MKVLKPRTFIVFAFAAISGALLLHTSQTVQEAQSRLEGYERSIENEKEQIRLLKAEWASLNRPERLEKLAEEFLNVLPPAPEQMYDHDMREFASDPEPEFEQGRDFEPVLQPVSVQSQPQPAAVPPKPAEKPEVPKLKSRHDDDAKDFNALIGEIGGGR